MKKNFLLVLVLLVLAAVPAFSQTARYLDTLLENPAVNWQDAAFVILSAAGTTQGINTPAAAFAAATEQGLLPANAEAEKTIRLDEASFLIMGAFEMKSGFMYSLFPGPRYAYRELLYQKLIQGRSDPAFTVSGDRLLRIIGRVLDYKGDM